MDFPRQVLNGVGYIEQHPDLFWRAVELSGLSISGVVGWIIRRKRNIDKAITDERKSLNPWFLNSRNRDLSNREFGQVATSQLRQSFPLERKWTDSITLKQMEAAKTAGKEMHTVRVLLRVQESQLALLRSYDSERNNIYMTDFESGALRDLSIREADLARSYRKPIHTENGIMVTDLSSEIAIAGKSYLANRDLYYLIQLIDEGCTLSALSELGKAKLYAARSLEQDARITVFGTREDPYDLHVIAFPKNHPGAFGKLLVNRNWGRYADETIERLDPDEVSDKGRKAKQIITDHIRPHAQEVMASYADKARMVKHNFRSLRRFMEKIEHMSAAEMLRFVSGVADLKRADVENELRTVDSLSPENLILV